MVNICAGKWRKFSHKYKAVHERNEVADFFYLVTFCTFEF